MSANGLSQARYYHLHMRLLCLGLALASAHLVMAQEDTFRRSIELVGCYELHVPETHSSKSKNTDDFLPRRFQLTMRPSINKGTWFVRPLDAKIQGSLMSLISSWHTTLDGTLHIDWTTGYVGYEVRLNGSGGELRGTAHYFTDTDPLPRINRDRPVVVRRVSCKESGM